MWYATFSNVYTLRATCSERRRRERERERKRRGRGRGEGEEEERGEERRGKEREGEQRRGSKSGRHEGELRNTVKARKILS